MGENIFLISIEKATERRTYHCKRDYKTTFKNPEE